jgi:hypothetical protein
MLPRSTTDFYRSQQRLGVLTVQAARRVWLGMGADFDRSWATVGPRLVVVASAAQLGSARAGAAYVPRVLAETDQPDEPDAEVNPRRFAGVAADGRSLDGLLYGAVTEAKVGSGQGFAPSQALERGGRWLDMAVSTLVADAGRGATGLGGFTRDIGYVRMLSTPSCSRCAILAGKWFRSNAGFKRHPRCDCVHIPTAEDRAGDFGTNPDQAAREGHITDLRPAETKALSEGADLAQLVNARRGTSGLRGLTTTEGTTRRGLAGQRLGAPRGGRATRLTPEGIYARAGDDRAEALRLLKQHGYVL